MQLEISRDDFTQTRFVDVEPASLVDGQVRLRVESFALTANNVTYALFGDQGARPKSGLCNM
jgi:hypothetical protein